MKNSRKQFRLLLFMVLQLYSKWQSILFPICFFIDQSHLGQIFLFSISLSIDNPLPFFRHPDDQYHFTASIDIPKEGNEVRQPFPIPRLVKYFCYIIPTPCPITVGWDGVRQVQGKSKAGQFPCSLPHLMFYLFFYILFFVCLQFVKIITFFFNFLKIIHVPFKMDNDIFLFNKELKFEMNLKRNEQLGRDHVFPTSLVPVLGNDPCPNFGATIITSLGASSQVSS